MPDHQFEFALGDQKVYTGLQLPEVKPLGSFAHYGTGANEQIWDVGDCVSILSNPKRVQARTLLAKSLNQGRRSSCNGYAAANAFRKARAFKGHPDVILSGEYIYAHINGGRDRGSMLDDGMRFITEHGVAPAEMVPHELYLKEEISIEANRVAPGYRAVCRELPDQTLDQLWQSIICALCARRPVVLAVHVGSNFMNSNEFAGYDAGPGNHAIHCDDVVMLRDDPRSFDDFAIDMDNSWGEPWGDSGRSYLKKLHLQQTRHYHCNYAIVDVLESPHDPDPPTPGE